MPIKTDLQACRVRQEEIDKEKVGRLKAEQEGGWARVKELEEINTKLSEALAGALEDFAKAQEKIEKDHQFYKLVNDRAIKAETE